MMTRPPGPGEPPCQDEPAAWQASLAALWALALDRFRDYLHWATGAWVSEVTGDHQARGAARDLSARDPTARDPTARDQAARDPRQDRGETHDPDR